MRIFLVGETSGLFVTGSFARALHRLGVTHMVFDEGPYLNEWNSSARARVAWKILYRLNKHRPPAYFRYNQDLQNAARCYRPDVVIVCKGAFINEQTLSVITGETGARAVNFLTDDPFNPIVATPDLSRNLHRYDILFTPRRDSILELEQVGARQVRYLPFGWDPEIFFPELPLDTRELETFQSDLVFVGNCDQDRLPLLWTAVQASSKDGWHLALYGANIGRFSRLKGKWRGVAVGRSYRLALCTSKIALCPVRHANRDLHTMRTFEIAGCGAFILAERTVDHLELFGEDEGAAMFSSAEEMLDKVRYYLMHSAERQKIAAEGHRRIVTGGHTYVHRLQTILETIT